MPPQQSPAVAGDVCLGRAGAADARLFRQRDIGCPELAVGPDADGLLVAGGLERDVGVEAGGDGGDLEVAATAFALKAAGDAATGFAPLPYDRAALIDDIGREIELIGVAGAGEAHAHVGAGDLIGGAAADALVRSVVQRHGAVAGPVSGHAGVRPGGLGIT